MHWALAISLQGSFVACVRMSKHTGHPCWSRTDRLFFTKGGLGSGYSGGMTGGGALLMTHPMIMLGFIGILKCAVFFLLLLLVHLLHLHESAQISVCIARLHI